MYGAASAFSLIKTPCAQKNDRCHGCNEQSDHNLWNICERDAAVCGLVVEHTNQGDGSPQQHLPFVCTHAFCWPTIEICKFVICCKPIVLTNHTNNHNVTAPEASSLLFLPPSDPCEWDSQLDPQNQRPCDCAWPSLYLICGQCACRRMLALLFSVWTFFLRKHTNTKPIFFAQKLLCNIMHIKWSVGKWRHPFFLVISSRLKNIRWTHQTFYESSQKAYHVVFFDHNTCTFLSLFETSYNTHNWITYRLFKSLRFCKTSFFLLPFLWHEETQDFQRWFSLSVRVLCDRLDGDCSQDEGIQRLVWKVGQSFVNWWECSELLFTCICCLSSDGNTWREWRMSPPGSQLLRNHVNRKKNTWNKHQCSFKIT